MKQMPIHLVILTLFNYIVSNNTQKSGAMILIEGMLYAEYSVQTDKKTKSLASDSIHSVVIFFCVWKKIW